MEKTKVVFVQLGSPKSPAVKDVRNYLREFLADPRVVDLNPFFWKIILNCFVLPFRPKKSAFLYSRIWEGSEFPLTRITREFSLKVAENLKDKDYLEINHAFLLSNPRVGEVYESWLQDIEADNNPATKLLVVPMFPQYSESTIASGIDGLFKNLEVQTIIPDLEVVTSFHKSKAFIDNSADQINQYLKSFKDKDEPTDELVISFHGIPKRRVTQKKDPYFRHCFETFYLIKKQVSEIPEANIHMTFQSRFGSEEWLTPYTEQYSTELAENGAKRIAYYCPSFVADCLETIDEIGTELSEELEEHHCEVQFIPCLNGDDKWCADFAELVDARVSGDYEQRQNLNYELTKEDYKTMPEVKLEKPALSPKAKKAVKLVFLTLFLDLVGFSIIFPLFPELAKYYLEVDPQNPILKFIFESISMIVGRDAGAGLNQASIVLFGGALGALYSLLQFLSAPFWGSLSDRIGRRPVLLISVGFLALSYLLWFFSGSFTLLVVARIIGGLMSGNISTATAVVADVTEQKNRSRGMAFVGIAFAAGFTIGPAMGGILSTVNLLDYYPNLESWGINPFSLAALVAFILSAINFKYIWKNFEETLPEEKRGKTKNSRSANPVKLFLPLPYKGVNLTNYSNFLFLLAFSGMEFTLTFLAFERLKFTSLQNGFMFIFIGFILAMVQGGFVRRKAGQIGEKKVALMGMILLMPGLLAIGFASSVWLLFLGLFFLATGSAMIVPCLTSLVSLYSPAENQGESLGVFRSLGALARVFGPIIASVVYWHYGSQYPYYFGTFFLLIPIALVFSLPKPELKKA